LLYPVRTETYEYVGVVLTKLNSDIECTLVGFFLNCWLMLKMRTMERLFGVILNKGINYDG
jgi:hypothetical protein